MSLPSGASFANGELERVSKALDNLSKDHHAPRQISVNVDLRVHHEYPRALYKGRNSISVQNESALEAALAKGYSKDAPEPEPEAE